MPVRRVKPVMRWDGPTALPLGNRRGTYCGFPAADRRPIPLTQAYHEGKVNQWKVNQ